jgi:hypothetical protein
MGNDKQDNRFLNEFNLREKDEITKIEKAILNYGV